MEQAITYDYRTIKTKRDMEMIVSDCYQALGWQLVNSSVAEGAPTSVNLSFKRNRKIANKMKLLQLQEKVDSCLTNIEVMQKEKRTAGSVAGACIGVIGVLTFGGGLSMTMLSEGIGKMVAGIVLAVVGIGLIAAGHFTKRAIHKQTTLKLNPALESEMNRLSDCCEEANALIVEKE